MPNEYDTLEADGKIWKISLHAEKRMRGRDISKQDIKEVIENPKRIRIPMEKSCNDTYIGSNGVRVGVNKTQRIIVTVIRHSPEYGKSKLKNRKNKQRREYKKHFGNRTRS